MSTAGKLTRRTPDERGRPRHLVGDIDLARHPANAWQGPSRRRLRFRLMAVKARLDGHSFDLEALERLLGAGTDPEIGHDAEGYYLTSPELATLFIEGGKLSETASMLLQRANGIARASDPGFRPVTLVGRYSDGDRHRTVVPVGVAECRAVAMPITAVVDGVVQQPPPSPGPRYAQLARKYPDVAEALSILGKDVAAVSLSDLYKVYEIVRENVGGPNAGVAKAALIAKNWVSKRDIDAFTNTTNTASISGEEARHARGVPKTSDVMTAHEARSMISNLVILWMESL